MKNDCNSWTYDSCKEEARKYHTRTGLKVNNPDAYKTALMNDWLEDFFGKFEVQRGYWESKENVFAAYGLCDGVTDFHNKYPGAYTSAYEHGWLKELPNKRVLSRGHWNSKENVMSVARLCLSRNEFRKKFHSAYNAAVRNGWLDEINKELKWDKVLKGYWNDKQRVMDVAAQCINPVDFKKQFSGAYNSAYIHGWLKELVYKKEN